MVDDTVVADAATDTILKRCDDVMDLHQPDGDVSVAQHCPTCTATWHPCDAYEVARDLRDGVTAAQELLDELRPVVEDDSIRVDAHVEGAYWALVTALTIIAERGEEK